MVSDPPPPGAALGYLFDRRVTPQRTSSFRGLPVMGFANDLFQELTYLSARLTPEQWVFALAVTAAVGYLASRAASSLRGL